MAEREAAMQIHHMWGKQSSSFQEVDGLASGASEHHGQPKPREPGGAAGSRPEHIFSYKPSKTFCSHGGHLSCDFQDTLSTQNFYCYRRDFRSGTLLVLECCHFKGPVLCLFSSFHFLYWTPMEHLCMINNLSKPPHS